MKQTWRAETRTNLTTDDRDAKRTTTMWCEQLWRGPYSLNLNWERSPHRATSSIFL